MWPNDEPILTHGPAQPNPTQPVRIPSGLRIPTSLKGVNKTHVNRKSPVYFEEKKKRHIAIKESLRSSLLNRDIRQTETSEEGNGSS